MTSVPRAHSAERLMARLATSQHTPGRGRVYQLSFVLGPWYLVRAWSPVLGLRLKETSPINNQPRMESTRPDTRQEERRSRLPLRRVLTGITFIFGGEIFCLVGPLRYERIVHVSCHTILYAGITLVCVDAGLYWADRLRGRTYFF